MNGASKGDHSTIVVLGAGIIGLTCAHRLKTRYPNATITILTKTTYSYSNKHPQVLSNSNCYTSAGAGGLWMEFHIEPRKRTQKWAYEALLEFRRQIKRGDIPGVYEFRGTLAHSGNVEMPWWKEVCELREYKSDSKDDKCRVKWSFRAPIVDMDAYLPWLEEEMKRLGVDIKVLEDGEVEKETLAKVCSFARKKLNCDILINCTGIGARKLCNDKELIPGRGVIVKVKPQQPLDTFYTEVESGPDGELVYVFPRGDVVTCGGCYQENNWDPQASPKEVERIVEQCKRAVPGLEGCSIHSVWCGYRPVRNSVRLEAESVDGLSVIHSYGAGGAGVTVSWGAADEVVGLVQQVLSNSSPSKV